MVIDMSTKATVCIALVKPGSKLAREWQLAKPCYAIYEYDTAFDRRELRWSDGSWQGMRRLHPIEFGYS